jgi:hypothetical protein
MKRKSGKVKTKTTTEETLIKAKKRRREGLWFKRVQEVDKGKYKKSATKRNETEKEAKEEKEETNWEKYKEEEKS